MMSENTLKIKHINIYMGHIRNILINRDIDCDENWWEYDKAWGEIEKLVDADPFYITSSVRMGIEVSEKLLFISSRRTIEAKLLQEEIIKNVEEILLEERKGNRKRIQLVTFIDNMKSRCLLEEIAKEVEKCSGKKVKFNRTYILDNHSARGDIKLTNINRFDVIQMPSENIKINLEGIKDKPAKRYGYVFTAEVYQLAEIYNMIGSRLFKRNVRYGINEQLGVDCAIKDTLSCDPEQFWFKNNGVTILVERPDFRLDRVGEILLENLKKDEDINFSVVNGAQTITASAEFFSQLEYQLEKCEGEEKKELEEKLTNAKKAKVVLRIIHIPADSHDRNNIIKEVSEISVALNRQKPIKSEDIAFASPFVDKLVVFLNRNNYKFRLVKRGEVDTGDSVDLVQFARARKACVKKPGDARSKSAGSLLNYESKDGMEYQFKDEDVFPGEWLEADDEETVFRKFYGGVNFAVKTAQLYEQTMHVKLSDDSLEQIVLRNGKWYFTAYMVQLFNDFKDDFTSFTDNLDPLKNHIEDIIKLFLKHTVELATQNKFELDSNLFKKNELFSNLLASGWEDEYKKRMIQQNEKPEEDRETERTKPVEINYIYLGNDRKPVENATEAFSKTIQYLLNSRGWKEREELVLKECESWLLLNENQEIPRQGYFRKSTIIRNEENEYILGTSSSTETKINQVKRICSLLNLHKNNTDQQEGGEQTTEGLAWRSRDRVIVEW